MLFKCFFSFIVTLLCDKFAELSIGVMFKCDCLLRYAESDDDDY